MQRLWNFICILFGIMIITAVADMLAPGHGFARAYVEGFVYIFGVSVRGLLEILGNSLTIIMDAVRQVFDRLPPHATELALGILISYILYWLFNK
ncbi:MAG: hypothetical protein MN733_43215 [Nitrososphaera sp.]|nr:hypothetical protein [Nitrososphaera sp.]